MFRKCFDDSDGGLVGTPRLGVVVVVEWEMSTKSQEESFEESFVGAQKEGLLIRTKLRYEEGNWLSQQ